MTKVYLVVHEEKKALAIGMAEWIVYPDDGGQLTAGEVVAYAIEQCAPRLDYNKKPYLEEIQMFQGQHLAQLVEESNLPEDYKRVSSFWETAFIDVAKVRRRKVAK